jgi:hypothetical protein
MTGFEDVSMWLNAFHSQHFGGGYQDWVDIDELDDFMQHLEQEDLAME